MKKGMTVAVYKNPRFKGCANGGLSDRCDEVTLIASHDFPCVPELFEPTEDKPPVVIVKMMLFAGADPYLTAYPADSDGNPIQDMQMAGGAFIYAHDSRFPSEYPVPLHDRIE